MRCTLWMLSIYRRMIINIQSVIYITILQIFQDYSSLEVFLVLCFEHCILSFYNQSKLPILILKNVRVDKKFKAKFKGLIDGDGYIEIGEQKQSHKKTKQPTRSTIRCKKVLRLQVKDKDLIYMLNEVFGVGKVSKINVPGSTAGYQYRIIFSKADKKSVILPLIKKYNLKFLTYNRIKQFNLLKHILDNNIINWDSLNYTCPFNKDTYNPIPSLDLVNLPFFCDWVVGFTVAEGCFSFKAKGDGFYSIRQGGPENYNIIKAICLVVALREQTNVKPDTGSSQKLYLSSKHDVNNVILFFSLSNHHPLVGYKLIQYNEWINKLRVSTRYKNISNLNL